MALSPDQIDAISATISPERMATYVNATGFGAGATALEIYVWNALISAAFFSTLHICEVVVRNAVAHALQLKYGKNWPWSPGFERSLPTRLKEELHPSGKR